MSIIIKAGWSRKSGRSDFGSEGTWCEIEIELDDTDRPKLADEIAHLQSLCKQRVEAELATADRQHREAMALADEEAAQRAADRHADEVREAHGMSRNGSAHVREGTYDADRDRIDYHDDERREPAPRRDDRPERRDDRPARRDERDERREPRRDERSDRRDERGSRRDDRGGRRDGGRVTKNWKESGGRPKTGKQLFGYVKDWNAEVWFADYAEDENLPRMFAEWADADVRDAVAAFERTLTANGSY
jgi:hypothetical protein